MNAPSDREAWVNAAMKQLNVMGWGEMPDVRRYAEALADYFFGEVPPEDAVRIDLSYMD